MNSTEFYEGYHSFKSRMSIDDCPYHFQPAAAKEWKRGFTKAQHEAK